MAVHAFEPAAYDIAVRGLTWTPLGASGPVLDGVDLRIEAGERVLLAGASGAGKSTLLRALAGILDVLEPGDTAGEVLIGGAPARGGDGRVGLLLQDPADARVAGTAGRDVAFGPENLGVAREEIRRRVAWALEAVGFPYGPAHPTTALSGGQAQRLALAGVLALRPGLLLLDEPTSMLDPVSAAEVREAVGQAQAATGATLVVVEHRLDGWVERVDRLVVLGAGGRVVADGPVRAVLAEHGRELTAAGVWVPGAPAPVPAEMPARICAPLRPAPPPGTALVDAREVSLVRAARRGLRVVRSDPAVVRALTEVSAQARAGRLAVLYGPSGAGKSTLLGVLAGLDAPTSGEVSAHLSLGGPPHPMCRWPSPDLARAVGWVPQRAEQVIVATATVRDCLLATPRALGVPEGDARRRADELLEVLGLAGMGGRHPYHLSGGELRRLAMATGLAHGPAMLALDEPTVGQDPHTWAAVTGLVLGARAAGVGVVAATHDDLLAGAADEVVRLQNGRRVVDGDSAPPRSDGDSVAPRSDGEPAAARPEAPATAPGRTAP